MARGGYVAVALVVFMLAFSQVNCDNSDDDDNTCEVLRDIADSVDSANCTTNGEKDCDTIRCTSNTVLAVVSYNVTVLPCNKPPGIRVTLVVSGSTQVDARIFTESANGTIFGGVATLIVTVDQLENDHIGVMLRLVATGIDDTFVDYTEIPVSCEGAGAMGVKGQVLLSVLLSVILAMWQLLL